MQITPIEVAQAIHIINRYAKLSVQTQHLYRIKKEALELLLQTGHAKKVGLDVYKDPRNGRKRTFVSVKVENFYFHISPTKNDYKKLQYLKKEEKPHNPLVKMDLSVAKHILMTYLRNEMGFFGFNEPSLQIYASSNPSLQDRRVSNDMRSVSQWFSR
ncbi:YkyB family protein [Ferdinandcohnia sp. SAFN-114]|uniref:YkyB family protein n=1 Tax=Ferdinandcohnia sp. SAFN-114 TaxID=3387275 RepID=UPI003F7F0E6F